MKSVLFNQSCICVIIVAERGAVLFRKVYTQRHVLFHGTTKGGLFWILRTAIAANQTWSHEQQHMVDCSGYSQVRSDLAALSSGKVAS